MSVSRVAAAKKRLEARRTGESSRLREDEPHDHDLNYDDGDEDVVVGVSKVVEADRVSAHAFSGQRCSTGIERKSAHMYWLKNSCIVT